MGIFEKRFCLLEFRLFKYRLLPKKKKKKSPIPETHFFVPRDPPLYFLNSVFFLKSRKVVFILLFFLTKMEGGALRKKISPKRF